MKPQLSGADVMLRTQSAVISLDGVVRVTLDGVQRRWDQLIHGQWPADAYIRIIESEPALGSGFGSS